MSISNDSISSQYRISRLQGQGFLDLDAENNQQFLDPRCKEFLYYAEMEIKDWIWAARNHAKLTQEQLGERMGKTKGNVSAWEKGRHEASFGQLQQISAITGYPMPSASELPGQQVTSDANVITELGAVAEIVAIYARCRPEQRKRILTAVRDIEVMGATSKAAANNKP